MAAVLVTAEHDPPVAGGVVTVSGALPVFPSAVAVTFAVPTASAVTDPVVLTPATVGADDDQVTDRPVNTFPVASFSVAVACVDWPAYTEVADSETVTVATGTGKMV